MTIEEILFHIERLEKESSLFFALNHRIEVIDFIEFHLVSRIEDFLLKQNSDKLLKLKERAGQLKYKLEVANLTLFKQLQSDIKKANKGSSLKDYLNNYCDFHSLMKDNGEAGYDNLDILFNGLWPIQNIPEPTRQLAPEMVYYQKTPARVVLELIEKARFTQEDVFFDVGSGLGQVPILVHLFTGIATKGIEYEPAFCEHARVCAKKIGLKHVSFENVDARVADYSEGTVFFMFTPFTGEILQQVLETLRNESLTRKIKILTYGPCTSQVTSQNWLRSENIHHGDYTLGVFKSIST